MIEKKELLRQIDILLKQKARLIPLLNRHISSAVFFSYLKEKEQKIILDYFQNMVIRQQQHIEILNGIKEEIKQGDKDVF